MVDSRRLIIAALCCVLAASCQPKSGDENPYVLIGVDDGTIKIFKIQADQQLTSAATTTISGATYLSAPETGEIFAIRPNEILALQLDRENVEPLQDIAKTPAAEAPTAVEATANGKLVLSAHFFDGQLAARAFDGVRFSEPQTFECGWAHQFRPHPNGKWAYAACMKDTMMQFEIDQNAQRVVPMERSAFTLGRGPRHMVFHPGGDVLYVMLQISSEIAVFDIDPDTGALIQPPRQIITTTPEGGKHKTSDLQITPNGKWLYGFNRTNQTMSIFSVNAKGALELSGETPMLYGEVRHFALSENGDYLVAATHEGHVGIWTIDDATGDLALASEVKGVGKATSALLIQ